MAEKITISVLKQGAVGQVISSGISINRYVIVEKTPSGVNVICLYGTVMGGPDEVFEVSDDTEIRVENRKRWKERFAKRWGEIAQRYPAIGC